MKTLLAVTSLYAAAMMSACSSDGSGSSSHGMGEELAEQSLRSGHAVESYLRSISGSWYGDIGLYRACASFSEVTPDKPWRLQTVKLHVVARDGRKLVVNFTISRNESAAALDAVYFVDSELGEASNFSYPTGIFTLGPRGEMRTEAVFWRHLVTRQRSGTSVSADGISFKFNTEGTLRDTLQIGTLSGDVYCSSNVSEWRRVLLVERRGDPLRHR